MKLIRHSLLHVLLAASSAAAGGEWSVREALDVAGKRFEAALWVPPDAAPPRALVLATRNFAEPAFCADPRIRAALQRNRFALMLVSPNPFGSHDPPEPAWDMLGDTLRAVGRASGVAGLAALPIIPFGHSAAGPWARNLTWHKPGRMAAMIHFNSGQLVPPPWGDETAKQVPILALNGEFEEFGPGGDHPPGATWEEQWLAMRGQGLALRASGHRIILAVDPGGGHYCWNGRQTPLVAAFLDAIGRSLDLPPDRRFPEPWLVDSGIKSAERAAAAPLPLYQGDPAKAWWAPDSEFAARWTAEQSPSRFAKSRQTVRFNEVLKVEYERDFLDASRVFDAAEGVVRVSARSSAGRQVLFGVIEGPVEWLDGGRFRLRRDLFRGGPDAPQKIRLRAWVEEDARNSFAERVAEIHLKPVPVP